MTTQHQHLPAEVLVAFEETFSKIVGDPDGGSMTAALAFYTTSEGGYSFNSKLQKQKPDNLTTIEKLALHYISLAFKKAVKAKESFYVYSGITLKEGQDLKSFLEREDNYGFFSASTDIEIAKNFSDKERGCCVLRILINPEVSNVINMENFSTFRGEKEVLLNRGAFFEPVDYEGVIDPTDGVRIIDFVYLGSSRPPPVKVKILDETKKLELIGDKLEIVAKDQ